MLMSTFVFLRIPDMTPHRPLACLLAFLLALICFAPSAFAAEDTLVWRGDHATGRAIMEDLAKEYARQKKGKISLQPFSTLSGLDAVAQGTADFGTSAREKYSRRAEEANLDFTPAVLDAAVLITHPQNPVQSLTLKQIYDIYYGRITNWKDVGGPDKPINLYSIASPLDGVEYSLRALVYRNGDQRIAAPRLYLNTTKLEEAVTLDPAGLGLSTLANTYANKKVKALLGGKPKMLGLEEVAHITGHEVGGVCPFGLKTPLPVYCDISLKAFDEVVPAAGSIYSAVRIAPLRMAELVDAEWVDVC